MTDANLRLDHQLCFALYAATNAVTRAYRAGLSEIGLTYPQYLVLLGLWELNECSVKDLGGTLGLDSATLTPMLKRLERAGFVTRRRLSDDERVVRLRLTRKAHDVRRKLSIVQANVACSTGLNVEDFAQLRRTLHRLSDSMAEVGSDAEALS